MSGDAHGELLGRGPEQTALATALADVVGGRPTVCVVRGEWGSGKTALLDDLLVQLRRSDVLVSARDASTRRARGSDGSVVSLDAALLDSLLEDPWVDANTDADTRGSPTSLAVVAADLARLRTVVIAVDNAEQCDEPELVELAELSARARLTWRETGSCHLLLLLVHNVVPPSHPLASDLARLARDATRVDLAPIGESSVFEVLRRRIGHEPARAAIAGVLSATGGIPLLVHEAAGALAHRGPLGTDDLERELAERLVDLVPDVARRIDEQLDEVLAGKDDRLAVVALLRQPFALAAVAAALDVSLERAATLLDDLWRTGHLRLDGDRYRFSGPLVRRRLLANLSRPKLQLHHAEVARRLAAAGFAPEVVASHLSGAGPLASAELTRAVAGPAADAAFSEGRYADAALFADLALQSLAADGGGDTVALADLSVKSGVAHYRALLPETARARLQQAREVARRTADPDREGEAWVGSLRAHLNFDPAFEVPAEALAFANSARGSPARRSRVAGALTELAAMQGRFEEGRALAELARHLAVEEPVAATMAAFASGLVELAALNLDAAAHWFVRSEALAEGAGDRWIAPPHLSRLALVRCMAADLSGAAEAAEAAFEVAHAVHSFGEAALASAVSASIDLIRGRLVAADARAHTARELSDRSDNAWAPQLAGATLTLAAALRGDHPRAMSSLERLAQRVGRRPGHTARALLVDRLTGWPASLATATLDDVVWPTSTTVVSLGTVLALGDVIAADRQLSSVDKASRLLRSAVDAGVRFGVDTYQSAPRVLARLVALGGAKAEAEALLAGCTDLARSVDAVPELVLCLLQRAPLAASSGQTSVAEGHLAEAASLAGASGLVTLVEAVDRTGRKLASGRGRVATGPPLTGGLQQTIVLTDVVGSTGKQRRAGDVGWVQVQRVHDAIAGGAVAASGGSIFAHRGDGVAARFDDPMAALRAALVMRRNVSAIETGGRPLQLRFAIARGPVLHRGEDLSGLVLSRCTRLLELGGPGEILVDRSVAKETIAAFVFEEAFVGGLRGHRGRFKILRLLSAR